VSAPTHPVAAVPDRLFADDAREERWRARFTATRMSRPTWARDAPDRNVYTSNATGTIEVYAWDRATDTHRQVTDRRAGTHLATLPPDGESIWWFADTEGDEFGHWVTEAFAGRTRAQWWAVFEGTDACVAPVWSLLEATTDRHNRERGVFVEVDGRVQPAAAPRFSVTPGAVGRVPAVGEHSTEIRAELGL